MTVFQPVNAPDTNVAYVELARSGVLIDLAGRPLRIGPCPFCPSDQTILNLTCHRAVSCKHCGAGIGSPCRRPSEHVLTAAFGGTHKGRERAAEAIDNTRERAGDLSIPAPWPHVRVPAGRPVHGDIQLEMFDGDEWEQMRLAAGGW